MGLTRSMTRQAGRRTTRRSSPVSSRFATSSKPMATAVPVRHCATEESWSTPRNVRRLMRAHELQPRHRKRFVATTDSAHDLPVFPNLAQGLVPDGPKRRWPWQLSLLRAFRHLPGLTSRAMPRMPNASIADGRSGRAPAAAPGENRPERPSGPFRVRRWPWSGIAALYATCPAGSRRL